MSSDRPHLVFRSVIACDDVRREDTGKDILLGVYSGALVVDQFPVQLRPYWYIQTEPEGEGDIPMKLKATGPHGVRYFQVSFTAKTGRKSDMPEDWSGQGEMTPLIFGPFNMQVQTEGVIEFQCQQYDDEWVVIKRIWVVAEKQDRTPASPT
jgi:hypothetical protein